MNSGHRADMAAEAVKPLRYLSVCSGIEAATQAWHPLGWEPLLRSARSSRSPARFSRITTLTCRIGAT